MTNMSNAETGNSEDAVRICLNYPPIEDATSRDRLDRLLKATHENGWQAAVVDVLGNDRPLIRYISDSGRAKFLELLNLQLNHDVLEIGPGLGQFSRLIAPRVRTLSALEIVEGQARFVAESCRQEGLKNVHVTCGGDDCRLPYEDSSFDIVILSLVLEWCGGRNTEATHEQMQARLLAEILRVLRPGGLAYVCTKNRFALRYLLGRADEHAYGMAFGNALPRWLMKIILNSKGKTQPAGWLYSYRALAGLLKTTGFLQLQSYWAVPEMRYPTHYIADDARTIRQFRAQPNIRQGESRVTNLVMSKLPAAWVRHVTPGLVFVVKRAE